MNSTINTMDLTNGFQPAINLDNRDATDENFGILPLIVLAAILGIGLTGAAYFCKYVLHGSISSIGWIPYCKP